MKKNKQKELDKEYEKLITLAEGTVPEAKGILEEEQKESKAKKDTVLNLIDSKQHATIQTYNYFISEQLAKRLNYYLDPRGFMFECKPTKEGVILELYSPTGNVFRSAFAPTHIAELDLNAIETFALRAENTIDKYHEQRRINPGDRAKQTDS